MNSSINPQGQINQSKRHRSVINPSMENFQILESDIISNNPNNLSLNKIKLRSNSLFAFQEFDKFTSLFENYNYENASTYNSSFSNSSIEEDNFSQNSKGKKQSRNLFFQNQFLGFNVFQENSINNNKTNNLNQNLSNNINNNYSNNNYNFNNNVNEIFALRRNSLGLLNNFLYYNYSFTMPYNSYSNYNLNNNNQFNSININSLKREKKNDINFIQQFYKCIETNLTDVINHQFGNYVAQKLFDILLSKKNKKMITNFFSQIKHDLIIISLHIYGTRVFQKILEKLEGKYLEIETEELDNIFKMLIEKHILDLCSDINGNHVFQKIVKIYPLEKNNFIFDKISENVIPISKLKQGVSIFENCFSISTKNQKDKVVNSIIKEIINLINDEYGNYTIQLIVSFHNEEYNKIIFDYFKKNIVSLSNKKFSSNVIDRAIIKDCKDSINLIEYMVKNKLVKDLIIDQFGNYVVQKALIITKGEQIFNEIIEQIKYVIEKLKSSSIGRKIYDHLYNQYSSYFYKV